MLYFNHKCKATMAPPNLLCLTSILISIFLTFTSAEITLTEGEQVALESTATPLPDINLVRKISKEIPNIRRVFKNVSTVEHQAQWAPGELLAVKITDEQIQRLRKSNYGLLYVKKFPWGGAHLYFTLPYNPVYLGAELESQFGFQSNPNNYMNLSKRISYNAYRREYTFESGWGDCAFGWPCLYNHIWVFKEHADGYIRFEREGGDPETPIEEGAASDEPKNTEPYPYAPNKKLNGQRTYTETEVITEF